MSSDNLETREDIEKWINQSLQWNAEPVKYILRDWVEIAGFNNIFFAHCLIQSTTTGKYMYFIEILSFR
jgi:hypothetical protein